MVIISDGLSTLESFRPVTKAMCNKISQYKLMSALMTSFMNMKDCCALKQAELWSHLVPAIRGLPTAVPECKVSQSSLVPFAWLKYLPMNLIQCNDRRVHYGSQLLTWNCPYPGSRVHILFQKKKKPDYLKIDRFCVLHFSSFVKTDRQTDK